MLPLSCNTSSPKREVYATATEAEQLLDDIGLPSGAQAIDVGCGVLGIVHLLRGRVGDDGHVVGADREPPILELARELAKSSAVLRSSS